jgi:hypothetical protein
MNVIVLDVLTQDQPQVPLAGYQHPVLWDALTAPMVSELQFTGQAMIFMRPVRTRGSTAAEYLVASYPGRRLRPPLPVPRSGCCSRARS